MEEVYFSKSSTIYLNRKCPRNCPYCSIVDNSVKEISAEEWCEAFDLMHQELGTEFFLILGTEPLVMKKGKLERIVEHLSERDYEYGFYTTAPGHTQDRLFNLVKNHGLRNVSAGLDYIDEVYESSKPSLPSEIIKLNEESRDLLQTKSLETLDMLGKSIQLGVPEVHCVITISRMNYLYLPEMIMYLVSRFQDRLHIALNYVEKGDDYDFDFAPSNITDWHFTERDRTELEVMVAKVAKVYETCESLMLQTPWSYFTDIDSLLSLDMPCRVVIPTVDADGTFRKCGYRTGYEIRKYSVFDLKDKKTEIIKTFEDEVKTCRGCYWSYPTAIREYGEKILDYRSNFWKERRKIVRGE